jgi:prophage DNA circulation protein
MSGTITSALTGLLQRLRPASFRGVPFGVTGAGKDLGRRVVTHKFPLRDTVMHEDLGRRERGITIEGFLVGPDIAGRMKRLETALERQGPGRLVHPHYGAVDVVVIAAKVMTGEAMDLATISLTFELTDPASPQPAGAVNGGSLVDRLGLGTVVELANEYSGLLTLDGLQDFVAGQLGTQLAGLGVDIGEIASLYGLAQQVQGAIGGLASWFASGDREGSAAVVTAAIGALGVVGAAAPQPQALIRLAGMGVRAPAVLPGTPSQDAVAANTKALDALVRGTASAEAARAVSAMAWESRDQALALRDQVADALDDATERAGDMAWSGSARALMDLRAAMSAHVTAAAAPLPRVRRVQLAAETSASILAYRQDGDALATLFDRAEDLVRRNRLRHPGFLPVGTPLEVLGNE